MRQRMDSWNTDYDTHCNNFENVFLFHHHFPRLVIYFVFKNSCLGVVIAIYSLRFSSFIDSSSQHVWTLLGLKIVLSYIFMNSHTHTHTKCLYSVPCTDSWISGKTLSDNAKFRHVVTIIFALPTQLAFKNGNNSISFRSRKPNHISVRQKQKQIKENPS